MPTTFSSQDILLSQPLFNIDDLSPYVEDYFEDPLDLRSNPFEEAEVDAGHDTQESS